MEVSPARAALDAHTKLYEVLEHPPESLTRSLDHYMTEGRKVAGQHQREPYQDLSAQESAMLAGWAHYTWPAETGSDLIRLIGKPLFSAPTYQVTGEITRAVTGMYQATINAGPVLRSSEMPSQTGFAYLDEPVVFADFSGESSTIRAFSWAPQLFSPEGKLPAKGVRVTTWADNGLTALPDLNWDSSVFVPYGQPLTADILDNPTRWLHCLWLFMNTEIVKAAREPASRPSRRRAERAGMSHSDITVILLRYRHYEGEGSHRDVDWSCRWVVQGHDRHLGDYVALGFEPHHAKASGPGQPCRMCGLRTTHIGAYVKGPPGKPLKPTAKVFRVTR